jgi:hypothetical protein
MGYSRALLTIFQRVLGVIRTVRNGSLLAIWDWRAGALTFRDRRASVLLV